MKNVYFVQVGVNFGRSVYLPYASGTMIASCLADPQIAAEYAFPDIIYTREKLADALKKIRDPYMVAFSCNIWNIEYSKSLAALVKQNYPSCYIAFGGHSVGTTTELLEQNADVDFLVFGEGENAFPGLLLHLCDKQINKAGSIAYRENGKIKRTGLCPPCNLSELPSPYTTGVFDKIMADNPAADFSTILETNRGCPYSCAFCDWTHGKKMRFFPEEKIKSEILWMAQHRVEFCYCVDSNFGMFQRDIDLIHYIVEVKKEYGFIKVFRTNYEKNSTDRVFEICSLLNSVGMDRGATISYQSLSPKALANIGRENLTLEHFSELLRKYNEAGIATYSELILGFPGETYESFCKGICTLLEQGQHSSLFVYLCELLPNAVMSNPAYIKKHNIRSIKVFFKNAHSTADVEEEVHEYSHLVRATDTMNEDDWVASNLFSICVQCFHSLGILRSFAIYLYYNNIADYFTFYSGLSSYLLESSGRLGELWRDIKSRYDNSLAGNWHYYDPKFGNITWTHEEGVYLEALYYWNDSIEELLPYIRRFDIPEDLFSDLFAYQCMIMKKIGDTHCKAVFKYDIPHYFENIYEKGNAVLEKKTVEFSVSPATVYSDWESYARNAVWYGRRKEANTYHKDEYTTMILPDQP